MATKSVACRIHATHIPNGKKMSIRPKTSFQVRAVRLMTSLSVWNMCGMITTATDFVAIWIPNVVREDATSCATLQVEARRTEEI